MRSYKNPVYPDYFADPFVWRHGDDFYAIGTGPAEASGDVTRASKVFPLLTSHDLVEWSPAGHALVRPDAAVGDSFWAPEIIYAKGLWYLYYSVGFGDKRHQIRVATADVPLGPYVDAAQLTDPDQVPFAIDPHPFQDDDGRTYLFHARDFLDVDPSQPGSIRAGTALVVSELVSMTQLSPQVHTVLRASCDWQLFAKDRAMYGRVFDWHTLEGPFLIKDEGRYYCLYSGGCWQNDTYGVDFTVADSVLGPYESRPDLPAPRVLRSLPGKVVGPGHCSAVKTPDESGWLIVYHAWDQAMDARRLCIDPLWIGPHGPRSSGPSWTLQSGIEAYRQ